MVTLLESDQEYNRFSINLQNQIRQLQSITKHIRHIPKGSRHRKKGLRKARHNLKKAIAIKNTFASFADRFVCELSGIPIEELTIRKSIAVRRGDAYREFITSNDRESYSSTLNALSNELSDFYINTTFSGETIYLLPLYIGDENGASRGKWLSLNGEMGTIKASSLGKVVISSTGVKNNMRVTLSGDIMHRKDLFFMASERFLGDLSKVSVVSLGSAQLSKAANGFAVNQAGLGGNYIEPCFCVDCPGQAKNDNCASGCCTPPPNN